MPGTMVGSTSRNSGFLKSRRLYEENVYQRRIHTILSNISTYKPDGVLMYGMETSIHLKNLYKRFFHSAKFKMIKAAKQQIPQYHRADLNGTTTLITMQIPALRHNRIETGFDWEELERRAKSLATAGDAVDDEKSWREFFVPSLFDCCLALQLLNVIV